MRGDKTEHAVINGPVRNRLNKHLISYLKLQEWLKKSHISSARVYLNLGKIKIFDVYKSAVCTMYVLLKQTSKKKTDMNKEVLEKFRWWRHKHGLFLYIQHKKQTTREASFSSLQPDWLSTPHPKKYVYSASGFNVILEYLTNGKTEGHINASISHI